jgi:signal transduction histidine kinase
VTIEAASRWPGRLWLAGLRGVTLVREFIAKYPIVMDLAFVTVLVVLLGVRGEARDGGRAFTIVFAVLLCAPLVLRRRYPLPVLGFMCGVAAVQWWSGVLILADASLLVALYTVAATCSRRAALTAAAVLEVGVGLAVLRWTQSDTYLPAFVFLSGMAVAAFVLGVNIGTRRKYLASLEDRARRAEHERDQQSQIAAAAERARIAREMHDIVAHNLSVMIALADGAAFAARTGSAEAESAVALVSATGRAALAEMHRLLGVLRDAGPMRRSPQPGIDQLDDLVGQVRSAGLTTSLTIAGRPFAMPGTAELAIYRLIQEALTNVLKHADSPREARVVLRYREPEVDVEISDDGRTADPNTVDPGHGLAGMRERAAMFGGAVQAGPVSGGGWRVTATLTPVVEA